MPDEADIADRSTETLLAADIQRARAKVTIKPKVHPEGLCCNDCGDKALVLKTMAPNTDIEPDAADAGQGHEVRLVDGVPTVFVPQEEVTRFCSKECADDWHKFANPPGTLQAA